MRLDELRRFRLDMTEMVELTDWALKTNYLPTYLPTQPISRTRPCVTPKWRNNPDCSLGSSHSFQVVITNASSDAVTHLD